MAAGTTGHLLKATLAAGAVPAAALRAITLKAPHSTAQVLKAARMVQRAAAYRAAVTDICGGAAKARAPRREHGALLPEHSTQAAEAAVAVATSPAEQVEPVAEELAVLPVLVRMVQRTPEAVAEADIRPTRAALAAAAS